MDLPSKERIKSEIDKELNQRNVPRMCENCTKWQRGYGFCERINKPTMGFMTCPEHEFKTEKLEREAMEYLKAEKKECEKLENLLAMMLTLAGMTICVSEDFERRTKKLYNAEKDKSTRLLLRKDLNVGEDIRNAYENILEMLRKIEQQYNFYVFPHEKRALSNKGIFDLTKTDGHLSNQFELLRVLMKIVKKVLGDKEQFDKLLDFINALNDSPFYSLEDKDIEHYKLKE